MAKTYKELQTDFNELAKAVDAYNEENDNNVIFNAQMAEITLNGEDEAADVAVSETIQGNRTYIGAVLNRSETFVDALKTIPAHVLAGLFLEGLDAEEDE